MKNGKFNFHYWITLHFTIVKTLKTEWSGSKKGANFFAKKSWMIFWIFSQHTHIFNKKKAKSISVIFLNFIKESYKILWKKKKIYLRGLFSSAECDRQQLREGEKPSEYKGIEWACFTCSNFSFFFMLFRCQKKGQRNFLSNQMILNRLFILLWKKVRFSSYFFVFLRIYWSCRNFHHSAKWSWIFSALFLSSMKRGFINNVN